MKSEYSGKVCESWGMKTKQTPTKIQNTRYLNDTLTQNCESLFKDHLSGSQMKLVVLICAGIFLAKSIQLQDIAQHIPGTQKLLSIISRISRFLKNSKIPVRETYESIIKPILKSYAKGAHLRLIIDGSKVGFGYQLLVVSLAYKHRAIPLAWTWIRGKRGHSSAQKQCDLLDYVLTLLPTTAKISLVGDCEFGSVEVIQWLRSHRWLYVLRQKSSTYYRLSQIGAEWLALGGLVKVGQKKWLSSVSLTKTHTQLTHICAIWELGQDEPWLLATNFYCFNVAYSAYKKRMWIEEMFGDLKSNGSDIESTHLQNEDKLALLTFLVILLYLLLMFKGVRVIKAGLRDWVDHPSRRDLSIFQIGLRFIKRLDTNQSPFHLSFAFPA